MFHIDIRKELSLNDLLRRKNEGYSVVKTPHVGNWYPNNLAVGCLGITMLLYDRNIGAKDGNFHPHTVIENGAQYQVSCPRKLMTHARAHTSKEPFEEGDHIASGHLTTLQEVFPHGDMILFTDYLSRHKNCVREILEVASRSVSLPDKFGWRRWVKRDGTVLELPAVQWSSVKRHGIFGLDNEEEGFVIPNLFNILISGIVESVVTGRKEVFHLSGPDMFRYIKGMKKPLKQCLQAVHGSDPAFPDEISFNLVPVAEMRFAVHATRRHALDHLMDVYGKIEDIDREKNELMRDTDPDDRASLGQSFKRTKNWIITNELREAVQACPEIFYSIADGQYLSQYDLRSCDDLYIHPFGVERSMKDIDKALHTMGASF